MRFFITLLSVIPLLIIFASASTEETAGESTAEEKKVPKPPPLRVCHPEHEGRRPRKFRHIELELERRKQQLRDHLNGAKVLPTDNDLRKVMDKVKLFRKRRTEVFYEEQAEAERNQLRWAKKRLARDGWDGEQADEWGIPEVREGMATHVPAVNVNATEEIWRRRSTAIDSDLWREERKETRWR